MQICGSDKEYDFLLTDWKRHALTLLSQHNPLLLGKAFARLVWCNPEQPRFASVFCKVVKEPGALVLTEPGEDLKACQCCTSCTTVYCVSLPSASLDDCRIARVHEVERTCVAPLH